MGWTIIGGECMIIPMHSSHAFHQLLAFHLGNSSTTPPNRPKGGPDLGSREGSFLGEVHSMHLPWMMSPTYPKNCASPSNTRMNTVMQENKQNICNSSWRSSFCRQLKPSWGHRGRRKLTSNLKGPKYPTKPLERWSQRICGLETFINLHHEGANVELIIRAIPQLN